jgi:hypothetical protein
MTDKMLPLVVTALAALRVGSLLGLWVGATTEQSAFVEILTRANLTQECQKQIDRAVQGIIEDYQGKPAAPSE